MTSSIFTMLCEHHLWLQNIPSPQRESPSPWVVTPHSSPPAPGNRQSVFCLRGFACSGHVLEMESYTMWPFVSGFFHLIWCPKLQPHGSFAVLQVRQLLCPPQGFCASCVPCLPCLHALPSPPPFVHLFLRTFCVLAEMSLIRRMPSLTPNVGRFG